MYQALSYMFNRSEKTLLPLGEDAAGQMRARRSAKRLAQPETNSKASDSPHNNPLPQEKEIARIMSDEQASVESLKRLVAEFVAERQWQEFHTPKNLAMALAIEAAEIMEHFQWLTPDEAAAVADDPAKRMAVGEELADVICYTLALASRLGVDVADAVHDKMRKNAIKYPADAFRGRWGAGDPRLAARDPNGPASSA
jgi:NTP pyrophosphatase (non-canonical NTP hydrolase)